MVQRPRGTRDFTPKVMARRLAFEQLLEERARRHGFKRVQTPVFESLDLFTAKSGPGIESQLYAFQDKSDRPLTLRPELTAPVMRMIAEEGMQMLPRPLRLSYYGQCYRYEESKKGRYREFFQYGVELIGESGPLAEAEVIALAIDMLDACGLVNWEVRVGHVGILKSALTGLGLSAEIPDGGAEPPVASAMRLLDKGDDAGLADLFTHNGIDPDHAAPLRQLANLAGGIETLGPAREILSSLSGVSLDALDELQTTLEAVQALAPSPPTMTVDLTVARGLDYYTGMVFEVTVPELGGEGQVLGGGSYKLLHLFGLPDLDPCCGFGLGFDRVLLALEAQAGASGRSEVVPGETDPLGLVAFIPFDINTSTVLPLVAALRNAGERVELELRGRKIGKAMKWANSIGSSFTVVVGPRDLENGQAMVKSLVSGEQQAVELNAEAITAAIHAMR
ncbi:MAG: histidine--tRNA ligase [Euryarchaeota archaeon]|nr:histidine--tRNA ligase [Euryarchaeota archaeon]|tara:strand:+ start:94 stop:1443 length:1350 start_codon:yes stop_codon:yes gene_type:complete